MMMCDLCKKDCGLSCDKTTEVKRTPHKHAEVIKAWADGAEIQWRDPDRYRGIEYKGWQDCGRKRPEWYELLEYRIKPEPSDLDKYGIEVGDVWRLRSSGCNFFVKKPPEKYMEIQVLNLTTGHSDAVSVIDFCDLIFRRGVVNKL